MSLINGYGEVWLADFEFRAPDGGRPVPVCLVATEFRTGRTLRLWSDDLQRYKSCPFDVGPKSLFAAYYASAELGCFLALGWKMPAHVLDLYVEFRNLSNGLATPGGASILGALRWHGLDSMSDSEKDTMRQLVLRGEPYTPDEQRAILDYCAKDVDALRQLLPRMAPKLTSHALVRGRYMKAVATMEWNGVPIDVPTLAKLNANWNHIKTAVIAEIDTDYGVFEGTTFKQDRFEQWTKQQKILWPRLETGRLALDDDTWKEMARAYPAVAPLRELRTTLSQMRLTGLTVGSDGRNRCLLSPFQARSGRNQPSNTKFIFGPSAWLRSLISPTPGHALAYVDYGQQEFGIAAALSGDENMQTAYLTGDPYLEFAKMAGAVPLDATKKSHPKERDLYKATALAVQYGMESKSLARRLNLPETEAKHLLQKHHDVFSKFWQWSDSVVDYAQLHGRINTVFAWQCQLGKEVNTRSLRNFPMQANGAEILRLACCYVVEAGIKLCAPIHDALLIEAPSNDIEMVMMETQRLMKDAGDVVLNGFPLMTEATVVKHPDRYTDKRGKKMWEAVMKVVAQQQPTATNTDVDPEPEPTEEQDLELVLNE